MEGPDAGGKAGNNCCGRAEHVEDNDRFLFETLGVQKGGEEHHFDVQLIIHDAGI